MYISISSLKMKGEKTMAELESSNTILMPELIASLSFLLQRVAESNDLGRRSQPPTISAFHGLTRPAISIQRYVERIFKYAHCSPVCYIVAYVYLNRFTQCQPGLPIDSFSLHRMLITSVMVSAKFMDDRYYNNAYYAKVGGISTREMNLLEVDFLFGLGFHLNVSPPTFQKYCSYLQREMMMMQPQINNTSQGISSSLMWSSSKSSKPCLCSNEEDSSNQQKQ